MIKLNFVGFFAVLLLGWSVCFLPGVGGADDQKELLPDDLGTRKFGSDWESFLGPYANSSSLEKGIKPWPNSGLKILWASSMAEGYAMPAISRGRAFLFDQTRNLAKLRCCNSETGKELWAFTYNSIYQDLYGYSNGPRSYPVVDGARVYIVGPDGQLHCLSVQDGKVLWKLNTTETYGVIQNFFGVGSTPVIEKDLLIVPVGGSPASNNKLEFTEIKGNKSGLVAFNKYTGKEVYRFSDDLASYSSPVIATIENRRIGFHLGRNGLSAFDPTTGKQDAFFSWRARILESVNASSPVVVENKVFISETYGLGSALLEIKNDAFNRIWSDEAKDRDKAMQCHWNTPVYSDGYLYGSSGRNKGNAELRCIEFKTGKVMWSEPRLSRCSLLQVDKHLICQAEDGLLYLLKVNPEKFEKVSVAEVASKGVPLLDDPCWSAPILSHGLLYVRGRKTVICIDLLQK